MFQGSRFSGSGQCWGRLRPGLRGKEEEHESCRNMIGVSRQEKGQVVKASVKRHLKLCTLCSGNERIA